MENFAHIFFPFFIGIVLGIFGILLVIFLFPKVGLLDFPERYGLKRAKLPYPAGISLFVMFFLGFCLFFFPLFDNPKIFFFFIAASLLAAVSFWDDRKPLSPWFRVAIQIFCAILIVSSGAFVEYITNPFSSDPLHLPIFIAMIGSVLWIVGLLNAMNWFDGIPNTTLGTAITSSITLGFLSFSDRVAQMEIAQMAFLFAGISIVFLGYNLSKTRFILGDSGAMFAGFFIATLSILSGGKLATALMVMAIPFFDAFFVVLDRLAEKKSPLKGGDKRHLHDLLLKKNWSPFSIFLLFTLFSGVLGVSALFLDTLPKIILIVFCGFFVFGVRRWSKK